MEVSNQSGGPSPFRFWIIGTAVLLAGVAFLMIAVLRTGPVPPIAPTPQEDAKPYPPAPPAGAPLSRVVWAVGRADDDVFGLPHEGAVRFRADYFLDAQPGRTDTLEGVIKAAEFHGLFEALEELSAQPVHAEEPLTSKGQSTDILVVLEPQSAMRQTARMLAWQLREAAAFGDGPGVAQAFVRVMALGRSASHRPLLISRLCALAIVDTGVKVLRTIIGEGRLPKGAATALAVELDRTGFADLAIMIESEQSYHAEAVAKLNASDREPYAAIPGFLASLGEARTRTELESVVGAAEGRLAMQDANSAGATTPNTPGSSIVKAIRSELEFLQRTDELRLMLAIERYREAKGTLPAKVTDLVPEFISDIPKHADGTSLEYRQEASSPSGYRVGRGS